MNSRLIPIDDWAQRAARAGFHIRNLAADCEVSERQLRRFIESKFGLAPHIWMMNQRLCEAPAMLRRGLLIKEVAAGLRFKSSEHFSRAFRKRYRMSPRSFQRCGGQKGQQSPC